MVSVIVGITGAQWFDGSEHKGAETIVFRRNGHLHRCSLFVVIGVREAPEFPR
jgi:hypothetical protein